MSFVVVATITPDPDRRAEVIAYLERAIPEVHDEDAGCELYALHEGLDRLVMIEKWSSAADFEAHGKGATLARLAGELDGLLTAPLDVQVLQPHPAGRPDRGSL